MAKLSDMYRELKGDSFPGELELSFVEKGRRQALRYEKVEWEIEGERRGLRYGDNPDQPAALYRLAGGNLALGGVELVADGRRLVSAAELLQFGKHPGKTNLTDVDAGLNILKYLPGRPAAVIVKHNNPCGVALADSPAAAFERALAADRVAAFGGAVVFNREVDLAAAEALAGQYLEVVAAPEYAPGVLEALSAKKNLRIMRIADLAGLERWRERRFLEWKALADGGLVVQWSFVSAVRSAADFKPAATEHKGRRYAVERRPSPAELEDMLFGWLVETGITSNSVIYVKDGATVGIGTGEQDRVGVAEIARDKAYRKLADRLAWERRGVSFAQLEDPELRRELEAEAAGRHGGLAGSVMISDAFFPFRDGLEVGLREGVTAVVQPGGSLRDFESIQACNEYGAAMLFTEQRCFRH